MLLVTHLASFLKTGLNIMRYISTNYDVGLVTLIRPLSSPAKDTQNYLINHVNDLRGITETTDL